MKKIQEIQMYDGDGVETPEAARIRWQREAEEEEARKLAEKKRYEDKKLRRELNYKHSLKSHPLTVPAIRFQVQDVGYVGKKMTILTEMPPEIFNHILEIHRPKMTVRSPMENYHHTVAEIEYPHVEIFHNPRVTKLDWELVASKGGRSAYQYTLTFTCSKSQDQSARVYKNLKAMIQKISA